MARFWKSNDLAQAGRPIWIGAASLLRPGKSAKDPWVVAADLDTARDGLINAMNRDLRLTAIFRVTGVGPTLSGRTADKQAYFTDGELAPASLATAVEKNPVDLTPSPMPFGSRTASGKNSGRSSTTRTGEPGGIDPIAGNGAGAATFRSRVGPSAPGRAGPSRSRGGRGARGPGPSTGSPGGRGRPGDGAPRRRPAGGTASRPAARR